MIRKQQNIVNKEHQRSWTLICCLYVRVPPVPIGEKNDFAASGPNVTAIMIVNDEDTSR